MNTNIYPKNIHPSWNEFIKDPKVIEELNKIQKNLETTSFYPEDKNVLRFLENDLNQVKVVILGMDPYPSEFISDNGEEKCVATGRSFEVRNVKSFTDKYRQTSLRNIFKHLYGIQTGDYDCKLDSIRNDIINEKIKVKPTKDFFDSLEKQGVLFLNATLTVEPHKPNSHENLWLEFMNLLLFFIENKKSPLWELWGSVAFNRLMNVPNMSCKHIYYTKHPRLADFVKSESFLKIKELGIDCNILIE